MKTLTRVFAAMLLILILASVMAGCAKQEEIIYRDPNVVGTWKQTDEIDGDWTWTFNEDGTCRLVGDTTGFDSEGTYKMEAEGIGKIYITLNDWDAEKLFTYAVTPKVLDLEETYSSFHCFKQ